MLSAIRFTGVLVLLVFLLAGSWACPEAAKVHSATPPGDSARYDPFGVIGAVQNFAGAETKLLSINARFVRADGTMDLGADYKPYAAYSFLRPLAADPDRPIGAGGSAGHEKVQIRVGAPGQISRQSTGSTSVKIQLSHQGMVEVGTSKAKRKDLDKVLPPPQCTPKALWASAIELGAPRDAVAVISYHKHGYTFLIKDLELKYDFDFSCQAGRERSAKALARDEHKADRKAEKARKKEEKRRKREEKKQAREKRIHP